MLSLTINVSNLIILLTFKVPQNLLFYILVHCFILLAIKKIREYIHVCVGTHTKECNFLKRCFENVLRLQNLLGIWKDVIYWLCICIALFISLRRAYVEFKNKCMCIYTYAYTWKEKLTGNRFNLYYSSISGPLCQVFSLIYKLLYLRVFISISVSFLKHFREWLGIESQ